MPWQQDTNSAVHWKVPAWLTRAPRLHLEREAQRTGVGAEDADGASTARGAFWSLFPQGSSCRAKRDLLCTYPSVCLQRGLRESWSGSGWGREHGQGEGQSRGTIPEHSQCQHKAHPGGIIPLLSLSTLPLLFCTRCAVRVTTGMHSQGMQPCFPAAPGEPHWAPWAAQGPTAHPGQAALHCPSSCNTCSPSGCSISLDQK